MTAAKGEHERKVVEGTKTRRRCEVEMEETSKDERRRRNGAKQARRRGDIGVCRIFSSSHPKADGTCLLPRSLGVCWSGAG